MLPHLWLLPAVYFLMMDLFAAAAAVADKRRAVKKMRRVSERTLLLLGALGGAFGEWIAMLAVHHKTRRAKFMLLLPVFFLLHALLLFLIAFSGKGW